MGSVQQQQGMWLHSSSIGITGYYLAGQFLHKASQETNLSCFVPFRLFVALRDNNPPMLQTDRWPDVMHLASMRCAIPYQHVVKENSQDIIIVIIAWLVAAISTSDLYSEGLLTENTSAESQDMNADNQWSLKKCTRQFHSQTSDARYNGRSSL